MGIRKQRHCGMCGAQLYRDGRAVYCKKCGTMRKNKYQNEYIKKVSKTAKKVRKGVTIDKDLDKIIKNRVKIYQIKYIKNISYSQMLCNLVKKGLLAEEKE